MPGYTSGHVSKAMAFAMHTTVHVQHQQGHLACLAAAGRGLCAFSWPANNCVLAALNVLWCSGVLLGICGMLCLGNLRTWQLQTTIKRSSLVHKATVPLHASTGCKTVCR